MIHLPYDQKLALAKTFVRPGSVFRLHSTLTNPPKTKYHVILNVMDGEVYFVFSNTRIYEHHRRNSQLLNLQIRVTADTEPCFEGDCYIDCYRIKVRSINEIAHKIAEDFMAHKGDLSESLRQRMKEAVSQDENLLTAVEKAYFEAL